MTNTDSLQKALREAAGECWQVDVVRAADRNELEVRITPHYFGVFIITEDMLNATRGDPGDFFRMIEGQLRMARENIVEALGKSVK